MTAGSFKVQIAEETLEDLRRRLASTRWTDEIQGADDWDYGTNLDYLKTLVQYWRDKFDWRAQEEIINRFAHFRTDIEGSGIHFIHERGRGENPLPLILTHGFPDSLAIGLNDSPAGLAAWIVEKFRSWSDCNGDLETRFTKDELLTNLTIYWATETINSSFGFYYDAANAGAVTWIVEMIKKWTGSSTVPTGFASFPRDLLPPPREWAERFFNIQRWTEMPRGGHWAALEEPELLAEDLRPLRT